jgi:hypothetical protein
MKGLYDRQQALSLRTYPSVLIAGAGGVGSWVALLLSLAGATEQMTLVDPDKLEIHNLNRTPYKLSQVGQYKVSALAELIVERRPTMIVNTYPNRIEEVKHLLEKHDLFIDCRDRVDKLTERSPIIGGYDKDRISLSFSYKHTKLFDSGLPAAGYTGAWVVPPVLVADLIVQYLLREAPILDTRNRTLSVSDIFRQVVWSNIGEDTTAK